MATAAQATAALLTQLQTDYAAAKTKYSAGTASASEVGLVVKYEALSGVGGLFGDVLTKQAELAKFVTDQYKTAGGTRYGEAWDEIGGARKQVAFDMKYLALTDPSQYAYLRQQAMEGVKTASVSAYHSAYQSARQAGSSDNYAKEVAKKAGTATMESQEKAMQMLFNDDTEKTFLNKAYKEANKFV